MNEDVLQTMVEYYRNKCNKLEYDFLVYKIETEKRISELSRGSSITNIQGSGDGSRKESDPIRED